MKHFSLCSRLFVFTFTTLAMLTLGITNAFAATWTVAASSANIVNGSATWAQAATENDMTNTSGSTWALLVRNKSISAGSYEFKVCKDHAWTTAYPNSNYVLNQGSAASNILYTFDDSSTHEITVETFNTWTVAGNEAVFGSDWWAADTNNDMTWSNGFVYTLTKSGVSLSAGTYKCKVTKDHSWDTSYPTSDKTFNIATSGYYDVTITFNVVTKAVTVTPVKVIPTIKMHGNFTGNWENTSAFTDNGTTATLSLNITTTGSKEFGMRLGSDSNWTSNGSAFTRSSTSHSITSGSGNCTLNVDVIGTYTFTWTYSTNTLTVTYPAVSNITVYFVNSVGWANPYCYVWNGGDNNGWPGVAMTNTGTTVCGNTIYSASFPNTYTNCIFSNNGATQTADLTTQAGKYYHPTYDVWFDSTDDINAECVVSSGNPVMTYGKAELIYNRSADIQVRAVDDDTPFADILYYCEFETPMGETYTWFQVDFKNDKTGYFELINLIPCSDYTLSVWAIDKDGNFSDRPKVVTFKTVCDESDELFLCGSMNGWVTDDDDYKYQWHTYEHDRYILIVDDIPAETTYKLYQGGTYNPTGCNLYTEEGADVAVFTAKSLSQHMSSLDEIYLVGEMNGWTISEDYKLTWENAITAVWEGAIANGQQYKLYVRQHYKCGGGDTGYTTLMDLVTPTNVTFSDSYTNGILTFDLLTWGHSWKNADDNLCEKSGAPRSGLKPSEFTGTTIFQKGYEVSIYTPTATRLIVTAKSNDWFTRTGSVAPIFMLFAEENVTQKTLEKGMVDTGVDDVNHNRWFTLTIDLGDKATNGAYTSEDLVADFTMGTCIRWAVKFEFAGGFSITDPMYYYIRQGCAPYYFNIYHHDDLPGTKGDTITTFKGGEILQPIIYRRKFTPGVWETLILPFTCSAVRVYDDDDRMEYDLLPPQHNSENAGYWLRTFGGASERDDFQPSWSNVPAGIELPEKDQPYIMKVPDVGGYYDDKYIMFYGKGYQTIASKTAWTKYRPSATGFFYNGNTTMWPQNLGQAYMITADGLWFVKSTGNTLYPFECYVVADDATTAKYVRMGDKAPEVATGVPTTGDDQHLSYAYDGALLHLTATTDTPISIYSIDGHLVVSSALTGNIESTYPLVPGIYIVSTKLGISKLAL